MFLYTVCNCRKLTEYTFWFWRVAYERHCVFADINAQLQSIASQSGLVSNLTCLLWFCNDRLEDMTETSIASRH